MTPYQLVPNCTVDDALGLAKSNVSAYWEETWWNLLWLNRTRESLIEAVAARTPNNLLRDREVRRHQKVVDSASGETVGYARWILPESQQNGWLEAQTPDASDEAKERFDKLFAEADFNPRDDMDDFNHMDDHIHEWRRQYGARQCLELDYLGVRPDHQRQGIGSMLVRSGVEVADKLGMDVFLVAMGQGACKMYQRLGFELVDQKTQDLNPYADELYETFALVKRASQG